MKYLFILSLFVTTNILAQNTYSWNVIIDSLPLTKNEIYSKTKLFMTSTWKSSNHVIENDDKEAGKILLKGIVIEEINWGREYTFEYRVMFRMKDGKANITLDNVYCKEAFSGVNPIDTIPIYDEYPEKKGKSKTGLKKEKYVELMVLYEQI